VGRVTENLIRALSRCDTVRTSRYDKRHPPRAQAAKAAAASVHAERVQGALSLRLRRSAQICCYHRKRQVRNYSKVQTQRRIKLFLTRASGLGLGVNGVGFDLLRQREDPEGQSL
jgi:hypothetical protein